MSTDFKTATIRFDETKHIHKVSEVILGLERDDLIVAKRCIECGKIFRKRRIKTEPYEEGDK